MLPKRSRVWLLWRFLMLVHTVWLVPLSQALPVLESTWVFLALCFSFRVSQALEIAEGGVCWWSDHSGRPPVNSYHSHVLFSSLLHVHQRAWQADITLQITNSQQTITERINLVIFCILLNVNNDNQTNKYLKSDISYFLSGTELHCCLKTHQWDTL